MADPVLPVLPRRPRTAYRDRLPGKRTTGEARGWGKGWPDGVPASKRATVEVQRDLEGDTLDRVFRVQANTAHPRFPELVGLLLAAIQEVGYPLIGAQEAAIRPSGAKVKQGGVGSYANRPIKTNDNQLVASEHSRAVAYDLWSRSNPQRWGKAVPFASTWHPLAIELVVAAGFEWGGHFWDLKPQHSYIDAMHIEYRRRPEDVPDSIAKLEAAYTEIKNRLDPKPKPPEPPEEPDVTTDEIKALQQALNEAGTSPPLLVDGIYGPATHSAVVGLPALVEGQVEAAEAAAKDSTKDEAIVAIAAI